MSDIESYPQAEIGPKIIGADQFSPEEKQALDAIEQQFKSNQLNILEKARRSISFRDYSIFACNSELTRIQEMQKMLNQAVKDYNALKKKLSKTTDPLKVDEIMAAYPNFKPAYENTLAELAKRELNPEIKSEAVNETIKTEQN